MPGIPTTKRATATPVTVTIGKGATVTALTAVPATLTAGVAETFTANIAPVSVAAGMTYTITGTVSFYDGTTLLGMAVVNANSATLGNIILSPAVLHTIYRDLLGRRQLGSEHLECHHAAIGSAARHGDAGGKYQHHGPRTGGNANRNGNARWRLRR